MQHRQPAKVSQTGAAQMTKGPFPVPPHDDTSHTWHHNDTVLTDDQMRGGQAILDDMGVRLASRMPGFGAMLEEAEFGAIPDHIKWGRPEPIRWAQADR
ncbi:hypothetical protein EEB11_14645 [Pseudotabrizicola sediminis]|uniref:Uncharacterized protein n=1 Tax=Pseudotabrizicola sediminis TaxID=2486418 RepID=A0ABY2KJF7_9RHOB|nr:hypothetical protein [Pseudotabrizicola sediminis]TGD42497.1 hypothetical protein EEB11_14645 [Pseudotabrizicola sediminis]